LARHSTVHLGGNVQQDAKVSLRVALVRFEDSHDAAAIGRNIKAGKASGDSEPTPATFRFAPDSQEKITSGITHLIEMAGGLAAWDAPQLPVVS
jgi:hypothetical protein